MANLMDGLSLSFCIPQILAGKVKEEDIHLLICGCKAANQEAFEEILDGYANVYWTKKPQASIDLAKRLYAAGKIDFPRNRGEAAPAIHTGVWKKPEQSIDDAENFFHI